MGLTRGSLIPPLMICARTRRTSSLIFLFFTLFFLMFIYSFSGLDSLSVITCCICGSIRFFEAVILFRTDSFF